MAANDPKREFLHSAGTLYMRTKYRFIETALAILITLSFPTEVLKAEDTVENRIEITFAFPDSEGKRLMALKKVSFPEKYEYALCPSGKLVKIEYLGHQEQGAKDNGRANHYNFEQRAGNIFRILQNSVHKESSCILLNNDQISERGPIQTSPIKNKSCAPSQVAPIQERKGRKVTSCRLVGSVDKYGVLLEATFEPVGEELLGSFIFSTKNQVYFYDQPAYPGKHRLSCWRVEDECYYGGKEIVGAFSVGDSIELVVSEAGTEGELVIVFRTNGDTLEVFARGYFYSAPI